MDGRAHTRIEHSTGGQHIPCQPGLQFGSRYVVSPLEGQVFDYFPVEMLDRVRNLETFAGMLAIDKWTGNANGRQATFWRKMRERKYTAPLSIKGTVSTPGSGRSWILRCAGFMHAMRCTPACGDGSRSSRGFRGSRAMQEDWSGTRRMRFHRSGMKASGTR